MTDTTLILVDSQSMSTVDSSTTLEDLTDEIKFYLRKMGQNVIEIGKRLILAKEKLPHGEWQTWLEDNFAFSQRTARQFMQIAERFGEKSSNRKWQTSAVLNHSQMVEILSLPKGEEENFITEKAAEGTPVADMSVKILRKEIKKYKAKLALVDDGVEDSLSVKQAALGSVVVEESVQMENDASVESVEESVAVSGSEVSFGVCVVTDAVNMSAVSNDNRGVGQNSLEQFFGMMKLLATGGNLQELVEQSAEKDLQALEVQLNKFAEFYGDIRAHLSQWKSVKVKVTSVDSVADKASVVDEVETVSEKEVVEASVVEEPTAAVAEDRGGDNEDSLEVFVEKICDKKEVEESDRHSIISALYQIALNDDENFTRTEYIGELMEGKGFEVVPQMSTKDLHNVLYHVALKFKIQS